MNSPSLEVRHLTMRFGGLVAVDDLNLVADSRDITAIIGPNGAGKTTVFNCLTGFYRPTVGELTFHGHAGPVLVGPHHFLGRILAPGPEDQRADVREQGLLREPRRPVRRSHRRERRDRQHERAARSGERCDRCPVGHAPQRTRRRPGRPGPVRTRLGACLSILRSSPFSMP